MAAGGGRRWRVRRPRERRAAGQAGPRGDPARGVRPPRRGADLGQSAAATPGTPDPTPSLVPAVVRDLFRKSGRPLGPSWASRPATGSSRSRCCASTASSTRTVLRLPGGSRRAQVDASTSWAGPRRGLGRPTCVVRRGLGRAAPPLLRGAVGPRRAAARGRARSSTAARPPQAAAQVVPRRPARDRGRPPVRRRRPRPAQRAGVGRASRPTSSSCFGAWTAARRDAPAARPARRAARDTRGDRAARHRRCATWSCARAGSSRVATAAGEIAADVVVCAVDPRRLPALAPYVERTMPALPAGDRPPRPRRRRARPRRTSSSCTATRWSSSAPAARAPEGGTAWTAARPRPARRGHAPGARPRRHRRARPGRRPGSTARRSTWSRRWGGSPYGVLWQGRGTVRQRLGPTPRSPGVYAAGAHATPGPGWPTSAWARRWSRPRSARPDGRPTPSGGGVRRSASGGDRQAVICSRSKISSVALEQFSV